MTEQLDNVEPSSIAAVSSRVRAALGRVADFLTEPAHVVSIVEFRTVPEADPPVGDSLRDHYQRLTDDEDYRNSFGSLLKGYVRPATTEEKSRAHALGYTLHLVYDRNIDSSHHE